MEIWIRADGKIYKGAMYSYYEFKQPMDKRLTDEEWQSMKILPPFEKWMTFITE
jgi:tRNA(His) 5'-end guanylyltransferase